MAFNTGNPVGSTDPRDFSDNAENFDKASVGSSATFNDRLGVPRKSLAGMEAEFNADQSARSTVFINFLNSSGYEFLGEYAASIEVTAYNQIIRESGEFWRPAASTTLPYTTTGAGMPEGGAFVAVGDAALRQELGSGVFRADLLTNLESTPGRFDGDSARLMGYSALSDGGEGNFRWDSSDLSPTLILSSVTSTSVDDTTDTVTSTAHGLVDGNGVVSQSAVNGLALNTVYWVVNATTDTFQLSETFNGVAFDLTGTTNFTVDNLLDPDQAIWVTPTGDKTGASGAWNRQYPADEFYAEWHPSYSGMGAHRAINYISEIAERLGGGAVLLTRSLVRHSAPIKFRSNVMIRSLGAMRLVSSESASTSAGVFDVGTIRLPELDQLTFFACDQTFAGRRFLDTTSPGDGVNFTQGDAVFVRGSDFYTNSGGDPVYKDGLLTVVESVSGDTIFLRHTLPDNIVSPEIGVVDPNIIGASFSENLRVTVSGGVEGPIRVEPENRIKLLKEGGGMVDCKVSIDFADCDSGVFTNACTNCEFNIGHLKADRNIFEIAANSYKSTATYVLADLLTDPSATKKPIKISEATKDCEVRIKRCNIKNFTTGNPVEVNQGIRNKIIIDDVLAQNTTGYVFRFESQNFVDVTPCADNLIYVGNLVAGASQAYAQFSNDGGENRDNEIFIGSADGAVSLGRAVNLTGGTRPKVSGSFGEGSIFINGPVVDPILEGFYAPLGIEGGFTPNTNARIFGNSDAKVSAVAENLNENNTDITNSTLQNIFTQTYQAGELESDNDLEVNAISVKSGLNGVTDLILDMDGVTIFTLPTTSAYQGQISAHVRLFITSATRIAWVASTVGENGVSVSSGEATISDISANPVSLVLKARKGSASDTYNIRKYYSSINKGF